jgi:hypothetical protein
MQNYTGPRSRKQIWTLHNPYVIARSRSHREGRRSNLDATVGVRCPHLTRNPVGVCRQVRLRRVMPPGPSPQERIIPHLIRHPGHRNRVIPHLMRDPGPGRRVVASREAPLRHVIARRPSPMGRATKQSRAPPGPPPCRRPPQRTLAASSASLTVLNPRAIVRVRGVAQRVSAHGLGP